MVCSEPCFAALFCSVYFIENLYLFLSLMVIYQLRGHSKDVRHVWLCFKGKRASRWARERISRCRYSIEVQPTNHINHSQDSRRHQNKANCVTISLSQQDQQGARKVYILSVLLPTVLSLAPQTGWGLWCYNICKFGHYLHNRNLVAWPHSQQCHQYSWVQLSKKRQDWHNTWRLLYLHQERAEVHHSRRSIWR